MSDNVKLDNTLANRGADAANGRASSAADTAARSDFGKALTQEQASSVESKPVDNPIHAEASTMATWILARVDDVRDNPRMAIVQGTRAVGHALSEKCSPSHLKDPENSRLGGASETTARFLGFGPEMSRWLAGRDLVSANKVQSEWKQNTFAGALIALPFLEGSSGLLRSGSAAPQERGYVSGSFAELRARVSAAKEGDVGAIGEIETIKRLRSEGKNVHVQTPVGPRGAGTADLLVGGEKGTGAGGEVTDVLTPRSQKPGSIIRSIADKDSQAPNIIVNMSHTKATEWEIGLELRPGTNQAYGDVMCRVREGFDAGNISSVRLIR